jgi:hypothetical protein
VVNQLKKCSMFLHTGAIEAFHSLEYASKEVHFSYCGIFIIYILPLKILILPISNYRNGSQTHFSSS